jgi:hypothetical protein
MRGRLDVQRGLVEAFSFGGQNEMVWDGPLFIGVGVSLLRRRAKYSKLALVWCVGLHGEPLTTFRELEPGPCLILSKLGRSQSVDTGNGPLKNIRMQRLASMQVCLVDLVGIFAV